MPHTRTIEETVYKFDELEDDAKEKAREWFRGGNAQDNYFAEVVIEDAATIAAMLGIDLRQRRVTLMGGGTRYEPAVYWSGFWSQGDGACFECSYSYKRGALKAVSKYAPQDTTLHRIALDLQETQKRYSYKLEARSEHSGHYYHSGCMRVSVWHETRDVESDADENIRQALRDFADWIYKNLEKEWKWYNANEQVDDNIRANEYEFDASGRIA